MKIKRVISCLLVAVFSMSLLLVQESAQAKIGTVQKILPSELHVEGRYIYNAEGERLGLPERIFRICSGPQAEIMTL